MHFEYYYQVKYAMYRHGQEVMTITFYGSGSSKMDWFSPGRVLGSPWTDLPGKQDFKNSAGGDFFSIDG